MSNHYKIIGAMAASALVAANAFGGTTTTTTSTTVTEVASAIESEIHVGYTSEYLFRGLNLGQDLVEAGADVSAEYSGFGISAGAWYGSFDNDENNLDELDLYGEVSREIGIFTAAVGYIWYHNFNDADDAQEAYASIGAEFFGVEASLKYFWDIETDNDGYSEFALSKGFELGNSLTLNVGSTLGYLAEQGQLAHLTTKVSLDYAVTDSATISPFVAGSWALSDDNDTYYNHSKNQLVGGVILSVGF